MKTWFFIYLYEDLKKEELRITASNCKYHFLNNYHTLLGNIKINDSFNLFMPILCGIILSMKIIRKFMFFNILLLIVNLSACQQSSPQHDNKNNPPIPSLVRGGEGGFSGERKLKVLTTIAPLYSFTKNITGDFADVDNLLPSGVGPHEYSFSPLDVKKIIRADVLIKNGVNLESWMDKLIASAGKEKLIIVDTSSGVKIMNNDPHIWLSPKNAIIQVENITNALVKIDPGHSEAYKNNAENYIQQLKTLDKEIREEVNKLKQKEFVAFHSAFLYFAKDYGLKQAAVIQEYPEKEPSPKHIAFVINTIRAAGIKAIFSEPQISPKIVEAIAKDLNLQVYSLDTLETGTPYPEWYEDKIRANLAVLKKALN